MAPRKDRYEKNKATPKSSDSNAGVSNLERHLGKTLMVDVKSPPKPTAELLKGKKLVGFYFTSAWNGMGKEFTTKLAEFYKTCLSKDDMEIVYVSSDDTRNEFLETFAGMPWLAIDGDEDGTRIKHNLATHLKVFRLPSLVILNVDTGHFVTDNGRQQVQALFESSTAKEPDKQEMNVERGRDLVEQWKTQEPEQLGHADTLFNKVYLTAVHFKKHPIYIVGIVLLLLLTNILLHIQQNPLLGMAMVYLLLTLGKEPLDKNIPYIPQKDGGGQVAGVTDPNAKKVA
ncbi:thioredoxin-like protein [Nitzschia inconspicua]|uniref:protein-disulfide reductase n=1 Tax=Nitzschia inconspicua TaxID=303405 RepID=A0A9K3PV49_9STRA|nr:thioredoxin-like protein [Nitzschia inconspicua]